MKITIDTTNKTVQVNDTVTLDELLCTLESLGIDYVEYKLIPDIQTVHYPSINTPSITNKPWSLSDVYYRTPPIQSISTSAM